MGVVITVKQRNEGEGSLHGYKSGHDFKWE